MSERDHPRVLLTPLCPAGHLLLKGGDRPHGAVTPSTDAEAGVPGISPLEEEMSRSDRGGALVHTLRRFLMALFLALSVFAPLPALAVDPSERLADPKLEQRARDLSANLRCMVCQNQSIDDSNADLARDLRLLVRERIMSGDSDEQVINYVVSRYGEFVLLKPRLSAKTLILWGAPVFLLLVGLGVAVVYARGRSRPEPKRLTDEEEARLGKLLDE